MNSLPSGKKFMAVEQYMHTSVVEKLSFHEGSCSKGAKLYRDRQKSLSVDSFFPLFQGTILQIFTASNARFRFEELR